MKHLKRFNILIIAVIVISILTVASYAWITAIFKAPAIIITTGTLTVEASFEMANDVDKDGAIDLPESYQTITSGGLSFSDAIPGETYTYRLLISNTGSIDGYLSVLIRDILPSDMLLYNLLSIKYTNPVNSSVIELNLDAADFLLFENYTLLSNSNIEFNFIIYIKPTVNNTLHKESIEIGHFEVRLDQISNQ